MPRKPQKSAKEMPLTLAALDRFFRERMEPLFQGMNDRFSNVDQRISLLDSRFTHLEIGIERRFGLIEKRFDEMSRETADQLDSIYKKYDDLKIEYEMILEGMRRMEKTLEEARMPEIRNQFNTLAMRIDALEAEIRTH